MPSSTEELRIKKMTAGQTMEQRKLQISINRITSCKPKVAPKRADENLNQCLRQVGTRSHSRRLCCSTGAPRDTPQCTVLDSCKQQWPGPSTAGSPSSHGTGRLRKHPNQPAPVPKSKNKEWGQVRQCIT